MDNHEEILDALTVFGKNPNPQEIPTVLEQYLNSVAKNGETLFPWSQLKPLILRKMELVIMELRRNLASENIPTRPNVENVRFDVIHARIIDSLHKFNGAPFTIQRLCELLTDPKRHYKRSDKFMRGLEKNVLVVSTVDPFGRKVVSELGNKPVLNGILDINGSFPPRDSALSVPLPPVPGWVNTAAVNRNVTTGSTTMQSALLDKTGSGNLDTLDKDSDGVVSNSMAGSGTQVFSDQGDPLAVQSEEVVEETVVTMDTGEVTSVVTDGGESLAEREIEADIGEDRDASSFSSSSSSSSSEELSTSSDSIENGLRRSASPLDMAANNLNEEDTAMDENRPWAAFAQDTKQPEDLGSTSSNQPLAEENQTSGVSSSSPHNTSTADTPSSSSVCLSSSSSPASSETQSSLLSTSTTITSKVEEDQQQEDDSPIACVANQQTTTPSDQSCDESSTADSNQSLGFDPIVTSPQHTNEMTTATVTDKLISSSTSTVIPTTNTSYNTSSDVHTSSSSSSASASDGVAAPQPPTYAQVVASSTTDKMSSPPSIQHISPYDSVAEPVPACDSVAGLERLVGSVEQSLSSSSSSSIVCPSSSSTSSSSPSSSHPSLLTTTSHNNSSAVTTSSLPESSLASNGMTCQTTPSSSQCCSSEEGEPVTKRIRLSVDEENMEEDCISTSGDTCMEEGQPKEEQLPQLDKEEGSGAVDSSSVEGEGLQEKESLEDIPMEEEEGGVTTGTSSVMDDDNKECGAELESTSAESEVTDDTGVNKSEADTEGNDKIDSNDESSTVSTTDSDDQKTPSVEDKE